jgi:alcohol dehydrogenase class IV
VHPQIKPHSHLAAHRAAHLLVRAFDHADEPDRDALALGALLAGYSIDSAHYGLHHVLAQTLVRLAGAGHGPANAIMLPHSIGALAWRFPTQHAELTEAIGEDPVEAATRLRTLTGATRLSDLGIQHDQLSVCADAAAQRDDLDLTPPRAERSELLAIYEQAA